MLFVDASVLANVLADDGSDGSGARHAIRGADLHAPDLVDVEAVAVLRKRWLADDLTEDRFQEAVTDLLALPITRYPALPLLQRAFELRHDTTAYDAIYVALAEGLGCPLLTADRRLAASPGIRCEVRLLTS
jgi:predicted nucleic acid-binding protein